jgi:hypothetical protein
MKQTTNWKILTLKKTKWSKQIEKYFLPIWNTQNTHLLDYYLSFIHNLFRQKTSSISRINKKELNDVVKRISKNPRKSSSGSNPNTTSLLHSVFAFQFQIQFHFHFNFLIVSFIRNRKFLQIALEPCKNVYFNFLSAKIWNLKLNKLYGAIRM